MCGPRTVRWSAAFLCAWILIYPHHDWPGTPWFQKIWSTVWKRNLWIAAQAFETQAACESALRRSVEQSHREIQAGKRDYAEQNLAWLRARCIPAALAPTIRLSTDELR